MTYQFLDAYGRPIQREALKREQAAATSGSVRRPRSLDEAAGLTPVRLANLLRASTNGNPEAYLALAEDMEERDLHYAGVLSSRKMQVAGLEIAVEAAGNDAASIKHADLMREIVDRDSFESELIDILDAIGKGFSCTEIIWDTSEKQMFPAELKWRDPRWFQFDLETGEIPLLRTNGAPEPLAPYKWIFHTAKAKSGLPIRGGIARAVCWAYLFKSFTARDWAIFIEAYGQPLRLGKYGPDASEKDKGILLEAVVNVGTDYAAIVPSSMAIEFIKAELAGSHELYEKRCDWLDRQTSKVVQGQTGTTDGISGGYAQAKVHEGTKSDIERSDAHQLRATLRRDLVRPAVDLNFGPQKLYPKITIGRPEDIDLQKWMANIKTFVSMGGKVGMTFVGDKLGVPDPDEDEELLGPRQEAKTPPDDEPPAKPAARKLPPSAAHRAGPPAAKDAIDDATDAALANDGWEPMIAPMLDGLEEKIAAAGSLDEARKALADHFRTLQVDQLAEILARLAFNARLAGEYDEELS